MFFAESIKRSRKDGRYLRDTFYIDQPKDPVMSKTRAAWKRRTGISDLKPSNHIRTSVASELADIKVEPFPIDLIQGSIDEVRSGRRKLYIASEYLELKKETLETWHKHLFKIVA